MKISILSIISFSVFGLANAQDNNLLYEQNVRIVSPFSNVSVLNNHFLGAKKCTFEIYSNEIVITPEGQTEKALALDFSEIAFVKRRNSPFVVLFWPNIVLIKDKTGTKSRIFTYKRKSIIDTIRANL